MNNENKSLTPNRENIPKLRHKFGKRLLHNWHWKLLALVLAIIMWAGLIAQDPTLIREKTFYDVTVAVSGAEQLQRNSLIVLTDLTSLPPTVRLTVDVPQKEYLNVTASTYNPRVDLSRIRETGTQELKIITTSTATNGTVTEVSPNTITVEVDEYVSRYRVPVMLVTEGEFANGFYGDNVTISPSTVVVSGPKTLVSQVRRAVTTLNKARIATREGKFSTSVPFVLLDEEGNELQSDLLSVTSESILIDSIIIDFDLYPTQTFTLSSEVLTSGTPKEGYEVKKVTVSPETIRVAAPSDTLATMEGEALFIEQAIQLNGRSESFTEVIKVRKPSEIKLLNPDSVTVSVEIGEAITERTFDKIKLLAQNKPEELRVTSDTSQVSLTVTGPKLLLDTLKENDIVLSYSLEGLSEGTHELPISCTIQAMKDVLYSFSTAPKTVSVTLEAR